MTAKVPSIEVLKPFKEWLRYTINTKLEDDFRWKLEYSKASTYTDFTETRFFYWVLKTSTYTDFTIIFQRYTVF